MNTRQGKNLKRSFLEIAIATIVIAVMIFSTINIVGCANDEIVTKDGIHYCKATEKSNGVNVVGYAVTGCDSEITVLNIPNEINNLSVIWILPNAFFNNKNLREIILPKSLANSDCSGIFKGCDNIEKVTSPFSNILFLFADSIDYTIPASLHYIYLSEGCEKINYSDFYHCSNIWEIHIPSSVTEIIDGTQVELSFSANFDKYELLPFAGCTSLKIYCAATFKPEGWQTYWNYIDADTQAEVVWGTY